MPQTPFYRWLDKISFKQETSILMYHGFTDGDGIENYHGKHLHIDTFNQQLEYLKKYYNVISLKDFVSSCLAQTPLPSQSVVLSIDDGYESNFTLAYPALKKYDLPATIFLTTDFIEQKQFIWANRVEYAVLFTAQPALNLMINGHNKCLDLADTHKRQVAIDQLKTWLRPLAAETKNNVLNEMENTLQKKLSFDQSIPAVHRPLTWPQIKEMHDSKLISIGAHTCTHAILAQCSTDEITQEITTSKQIIEQKLNTPCELFCYPYGSNDTFNVQTKSLLQKAGYTCALTTIKGSNNQHTDLFGLKRIGTSNLADLENFRSSLLKSPLNGLGKIIAKISKR